MLLRYVFLLLNSDPVLELKVRIKIVARAPNTIWIWGGPNYSGPSTSLTYQNVNDCRTMPYNTIGSIWMPDSKIFPNSFRKLFDVRHLTIFDRHRLHFLRQAGRLLGHPRKLQVPNYLPSRPRRYPAVDRLEEGRLPWILVQQRQGHPVRWFQLLDDGIT